MHCTITIELRTTHSVKIINKLYIAITYLYFTKLSVYRAGTIGGSILYTNTPWGLPNDHTKLPDVTHMMLQHISCCRTLDPAVLFSVLGPLCCVWANNTVTVNRQVLLISPQVPQTATKKSPSIACSLISCNIYMQILIHRSTILSFYYFFEI